MLKAGDSVAAIAAELGVSEPTVYNAVRRLGLTLPSKSKAATSPEPRASADAAAAPRRRNATPTGSTTGKSTTSRRTTSKRSKATSTDAASDAASQTIPGTGLVPIGPDTELLTVRVDKGIELLKNLSARIVRHERELAAARQRYAETLASLALTEPG